MFWSVKKPLVLLLSGFLLVSLASCRPAQAPVSSCAPLPSAGTATSPAASSPIPPTAGGTTAAPTTIARSIKTVLPSTKAPTTKAPITKPPATRPPSTAGRTPPSTTTQPPASTTAPPQPDDLQAALDRCNAAVRRMQAQEVYSLYIEEERESGIFGETIRMQGTREIYISNTAACRALIGEFAGSIQAQAAAPVRSFQMRMYAADGFLYELTSIIEAPTIPIIAPLSESDLQELLGNYDMLLSDLGREDVLDYAREDGFDRFTLQPDFSSRLVVDGDDPSIQFEWDRCVWSVRLNQDEELVKVRLEADYAVTTTENDVSIRETHKQDITITYRAPVNLDFSKPDWAAAMDVAA